MVFNFTILLSLLAYLNFVWLRVCPSVQTWLKLFRKICIELTPGQLRWMWFVLKLLFMALNERKRVTVTEASWETNLV